MMKKKEQRISPAGFAILQQTILESEMAGYGLDACASHALHSVGLSPEPFCEIMFVVDPTLDGPVYPFMEWPAELRNKR